MDFKLAIACAVIIGSLVDARSCPGLYQNEFVHGNNINAFFGCSVIEGDLRILEATFNGDLYQELPAIDPRDLRVFESVTVITGHLVIQGVHEDFRDLSFLCNLQRIGGESQSYVGAALQIYGTSIASLELRSLRSIGDGIVVIGHNEDLCYVDRINWFSLFTPGSDQRVSIKFNRASKECEDEGRVCHFACGADGCWGPGEGNCLTKCNDFFYDGRCMSINDCMRTPGFYVVGGVCGRCEPGCDRCSGPGPGGCMRALPPVVPMAPMAPIYSYAAACRGYRWAGECLDSCPDFDYAAQRYVYAEMDGTCQYCDPQCDGGCRGRGADSCARCKVCMDDYRCVPSCPDNKFVDENGFCQFCDPQCISGCHGPRGNQCMDCRSVIDDGFCVAECPAHKYTDNGQCRACDDQCQLGCHGQGPFQCIACKNVMNDNECVAECPEGRCADDAGVCGPCSAMPTYQQLVEQVADLEFQAGRMQNRIESAVAFTAFSMRERTDYYEGERLIFDGIITNIGGGYDPETSVFTCPRTGLYMFIISVDNYMRGSLIPSLYRGDVMIASAGAYNSASQTVVVACDRGQTVSVHTNHGGSMFNMEEMRTSTFSGLLLATKDY